MRKQWEPVLWGLKRCRDPSHPARLFRAWGKGLWRHHFQTWCQPYCFREMLEGSSSVSLQSPSRKPGLLFFQCIPVYLLSHRWGGDYVHFQGHVLPEPPDSAGFTSFAMDTALRISLTTWVTRDTDPQWVHLFYMIIVEFPGWQRGQRYLPLLSAQQVGFLGGGPKILVFSSPFHRPGHTACSLAHKGKWARGFHLQTCLPSAAHG